MAVMVLLGVGLGWFVRQAQRQRKAVEAIREAGAVVIYDYQLDEDEPGMFTPEREPPTPAWLRRLLGVDLFSDVVVVDVTGTHVTEEGIRELRNALPNCEIYWDGEPNPLTPLQDQN